jgi:hypothetical protein
MMGVIWTEQDHRFSQDANIWAIAFNGVRLGEVDTPLEAKRYSLWRFPDNSTASITNDGTEIYGTFTGYKEL